jgi:polysaccharide deacetylase 2 family uncharacterized protein YibQ
MERREFLIKSASFLLGTLVGLDGLAKAFAASPPRIALIIDDIGHSLCRARHFLELGIPITYAILPRLPHSHDLAHEIHEQGHEIMLHQPMEPSDRYLNPGPGALYVGDEARRIVRIMEENIEDVPFARGVNNHMGSRFTASEREVHQALGVVKENGLFFVDSLTTHRSVAFETARRLHMPAAFRNIFLDNDREEESVFSRLQGLKAHAFKYGQAIGIGHPHTETARAIGHFVKGLGSNLSLVHVSQLIDPA